MFLDPKQQLHGTICGIICDLVDVKLCFSLRKPDMRLLCPESWELDGNCISFCHFSAVNSLFTESRSPMKSITT